LSPTKTRLPHARSQSHAVEYLQQVNFKKQFDDQPVVIVKQFQTPKPYSGQTSHKSFKEHFERVAKANGWTLELEKMQNSALECLRKVKEYEVGAYEQIWSILARRFGHLDEPERSMRRFDSRKQLEGESVVEYEQALRTLYREAWPRADDETKDSALKRKFEEVSGHVAIPKITLPL